MKKVPTSVGLLIIIVVSVTLFGCIFYYKYSSLSKIQIQSVVSSDKAIPGVENPSMQTLKEIPELPIKDKAQNEINFSKAQIYRVNQIFQDVKDIYSKIERKYTYDGMREARTMMSDKPVVLLQKGKAMVDFDKILLTESKNIDTDNSAFVHLPLLSVKGDDNIEFNYRFINGGDGDQLGIWIDDEQRFILTGNLAGNELRSTNIDITDLKEENHIISFALHKYGEINAEVEVSGIKINSIKKNILLEIQNEYKNLKSLNDFQIEKNPDYSVLETINELPPTEETSTLWGIGDILKKADIAYNDSEYDKAYAYAFYARLIAEKIILGWKQF